MSLYLLGVDPVRFRRDDIVRPGNGARGVEVYLPRKTQDGVETKLSVF